MQADPSDNDLAWALEEAEFAQAAGEINRAELYAAESAEVKRRRLRHRRLRARRYGDETEGEYLDRRRREKMERHRTMPYPSAPDNSVYDPSDPRNNLWGQHSPMLLQEKQHMERIARDWFLERGPIWDDWNITNFSILKNYSTKELDKLESVTWIADVTNAWRTLRLRVLHNPSLNGERSIILISGARRTYESKHRLW